MDVNTSFVVSIEGTEHMCMHITLFTGSSPEKWGWKEAGNSKKTIYTHIKQWWQFLQSRSHCLVYYHPPPSVHCEGGLLLDIEIEELPCG